MKPQKVTESDSHYGDLEKKSALELVQIINAEDAKVANAVAQTLPEIAELVERVLPRFLSGGDFSISELAPQVVWASWMLLKYHLLTGLITIELLA